MVKYIIEDEGMGIPESEMESVFNKFIQSSKTSTDSGGTGLVLAICKQIIRGHLGKIWAEQNINTGSRFCFYLSIDRF